MHFPLLLARLGLATQANPSPATSAPPPFPLRPPMLDDTNGSDTDIDLVRWPLRVVDLGLVGDARYTLVRRAPPYRAAPVPTMSSSTVSSV
jgi:hypothetical protein